MQSLILKSRPLRVSALASRGGRLRSRPYSTPAIQFTPCILHPHVFWAPLLLHAGGRDQPSPPTTILLPTLAALTYGSHCTPWKTSPMLSAIAPRSGLSSIECLTPGMPSAQPTLPLAPRASSSRHPKWSMQGGSCVGLWSRVNVWLWMLGFFFISQLQGHSSPCILRS
jgi:hypothetical protein